MDWVKKRQMFLAQFYADTVFKYNDDMDSAKEYMTQDEFKQYVDSDFAKTFRKRVQNAGFALHDFVDKYKDRI